ncbi:hypothetical protein NIES2101_27035 [Calothrix sp. HK-06]|nr:hypothetical protein NIES2101_27035 [Calothrix sp. HK-06]
MHSEATQAAPNGIGYPNTPGIYNQAQVGGWKQVTDAVHVSGGRIFYNYATQGELPILIFILNILYWESL